MYTQNEVIKKLNDLKQYSIDQKPEYEDGFEDVMGDLYVAVNSYFNCDRSDFKKALEDLCLFAYNDLWIRNAKFEFEFDLGYSDTIPFEDLRTLFFSFDNLMKIDNETFYKSWVFEVDPLTSKPTPSKNNHIDSIVSTLKTAIEDELADIKTLAKWFEDDLQNSTMVSLWENQGALLEVKDTKQLANLIFIEYGLLEAIKTLNLDVYIPSYLQGENHD